MFHEPKRHTKAEGGGEKKVQRVVQHDAILARRNHVGELSGAGSREKTHGTFNKQQQRVMCLELWHKEWPRTDRYSPGGAASVFRGYLLPVSIKKSGYVYA